ncbi:carboxypeptidase B-like [Ostrinia furnacalis]|uniref:carboxypeptidase B-like n=1 Tax=Ostrinia furnacalis TaxID=93504 RepID=UPI00103AD7D3|nr:carboxypeptidase B-like [Ostrinia furnacalis]
MANLLKSVLLFCVIFYVVCAKHEQYEGHSLYEVFVKNAEQTKFIHELENQIPIQVFVYGHTEKPGQILVSKELKSHFEELLASMDVDYNIKVANVREQLELEDKLLANAASKRSNRSSSRLALPYDEIHRYQVVDDYLVRLGNAYPNLVKVESAGSSLLGRDMKYLKISTTNFEDRRKPVIFLMSLLHAREWVTLPATLYAIEKLVIDVTDSDLVNDLDWIILPIANPDGYEHSHDSDRFWRKNRREGISSFCMGVDLNRNFDAWWGTASSNSWCFDTFHGAGPFSEPETDNIRRILEEHADRIELFIDIHSFGSMVLFGFGTGQLPPNALALNVVGVNMAQAIDRVKWPSKPNYQVGNIVHVLRYTASGGSSDYAQAGAGIPLSYTYELPAFDGHTTVVGFLVDPAFIEQAGFETFEGIKAGARFVRDMLSMKRDN